MAMNPMAESVKNNLEDKSKFVVWLLVVDVAPEEAHILSEKCQNIEEQTWAFWDSTPWTYKIPRNKGLIAGGQEWRETNGY